MLSKLIPVLFLSLALLSSVVLGLPNPRVHDSVSSPRLFRKRLNSLGLQARAKGNIKADANNTNNGDDATSQCLDPTLVNIASSSNGLQNATEQGTTASATSSNNFINFCKGQVLTNGTQNPAGSCNGIPMGKNLDTIASNTNFTFTLQAQNIALGSFADAASTYFAAPADVDGQGQYIGHTHLAVQKTQSLTSTELLDSQNFTFFQGINAPQDKNGEISITVTGLPEGTYRMCTISTAANHQTLNGPVAQRGHFDDCIQITAKDGGGQSNNATGTTTVNNNNGTASNSVNNKTGTNNTTSTNNKSGTKNKSGANNNKEDATDTDTGDCKDDNQGTTNNGKTGHKTTGNGNDKDNSQKTINAGNNNGTTQNTNGTSNGQKTDATAKHHNNTNTNGTTKSGDKGTTNDTSCDT